MMLLVHSETSARTLARNLGRSEYSYYFVLRLFRPLLAQLGTVVEIEDPEVEIDPLWRAARSRGEPALFLCFSPPHKLPVGLACPTIPVFAWEFDTLPDEAWLGDARQDWVAQLSACAAAIVHSSHTEAVVRRHLGHRLALASIPAPVWSRYGAMRGLVDDRPIAGRRTALAVETPHLDTLALDLDGYDRFAPDADRLERTEAILARHAGPRTLELDGVVYSSVLNPFDGRKRCFDMIANFVWAFRDRPDATLLLKITQSDVPRVMSALLGEIVRNQPFACRLVAIQGLLAQESYDALVRATTYVVNCSTGEGQCLPLMEFMSCGKPAVAPRHTALADYIDADNAFLVDAHPEPTIWPHDDRGLFRTTRQRIDTHSLIAAYRTSFAAARLEPARYEAMSARASRAIEAHCADGVVLGRLAAILHAASAQEAAA